MTASKTNKPKKAEVVTTSRLESLIEVKAEELKKLEAAHQELIESAKQLSQREAQIIDAKKRVLGMIAGYQELLDSEATASDEES